MKKIRTFLTVTLLLSLATAYAQDYAETALLFSRTKPAGSARILGMGGSQTALGGDFSSALSNPAGLGMFNRSEFTFSLGLADHRSSANYLGTHADDNRSVFNIPAFSYVWHSPREGDQSFYGGSFGISFSRVNDFNRSTVYSGDNQNNSIIDFFIDRATGETTDQFFEEQFPNYNTPTALAYFNYLIGPTSILNPPGPDDEYFTDAAYPFQTEEVLVKGSANQWSFSYGGNVKDMFFFGGGIGITSLRYESQKVFTETFASDTLEALQLVEELSIRGSGFNATVGAILRPVNFFQVGVSYTTPTYYGLSETYTASMWSRWNNFDYYGDGETILGDNSSNPEETELVASDYRLITPSRLRGGVAFISQYGLLTADVEMLNPAKAKYRSPDNLISFEGDNQSIQTVYKPVVNYRIGAEFRKDIFRARAGYAVQANTFDDSIGADNKISSISGGLGIRLKTFYIDLAVVSTTGSEYQYQPYTFSDGSGPVVDIKDRTLNGVLTVGFSL